MPSLRSLAPTENPGSSRWMTKALIPLAPRSGSVTAITVYQVDCPALVIQHFVPLSTQWSPSTRARLDGDHWVLNGTKCWITNAGESTWYTVMAVTDPDRGASGISAFVVHQDDPGFSVGSKERKLGIRGSPTREIYFEDCTIPAERIIGEPGSGFKTALQTLDHTRPTIGAQAVGIAQGAVDSSIAYVKQRKQFGKLIADFQGVQFMLAEMAMKTEAARQLVYVAAARAERGENKLGFISSASKCFASDVAMDVTTDAVQLFGGYGYLPDFPLG